MGLKGQNSNFSLGRDSKGTLRFFFLVSLILGLSPLEIVAEEKGLTKIAKLEGKVENSVFVVSDEELESYSSTAELIRELKILRKDKETLSEYSKELREKFKALENYCTKNGKVCPSTAPKSHNSELLAQLENQKLQNNEMHQSLQNIKTDYEALKLQRDALKKDYQKLNEDFLALKESQSNENKVLFKEKDELKAKHEELNSLLSKKTEESKACFEQLDQSQKLVLELPELEKEIMSLKNELLMRKSAAELLGSTVVKKETADVRLETSSPRLNSRKVVSQEVPSAGERQRTLKQAPALNSDIMVIEVTGDKVALRAGPGQNNSAIMDIARGAKLTVEAKEGDWYRVNSPTGGRAYIHGDYVKVIEGGIKNQIKKSHLSQRAQIAKVSDGFGEDFVPMEVEPVKPPLPIKAVKRIGKEENLANDKVGVPSSKEAIALDALKRAMKSE